MDRTKQIEFETLELEFRLTQLLKKREQLYLKGGNDEKLNDKIRAVQQELRNKGSNQLPLFIYITCSRKRKHTIKVNAMFVI